jgi:L-asparaginase / beta-aspartyl-peptidase
LQYFIRHATASTIAHRAKLLGEPLQKAAQHAVEELRKDGGLGGVIALDRNGNGKIDKLFISSRHIEPPTGLSPYHPVAMPMNSSGMYRGVVREDGVPKTAIFRDDVLS